MLATQNPIESEGTFPLPAAQLDRFMMRLSLGYPDREAELAILEENPAERLLAALRPVITVSDFNAARLAVETVFCHPSLKEAVADIVRETRTHKGVLLGASPRAGLHLLQACRAMAMVKGRAYATDEDLLKVAPAVLAHRIRLRDPRSRSDALIREISLARAELVKTN